MEFNAPIWKPAKHFSRWFRLKTRYIVVHWSAGSTFDSAFDTINKAGTSYHYIVDGETVWKLVDEKHVAYHAGDWLANRESIGVCHIGMYTSPVKDASYVRSGKLIADLLKANNLEPSRDTIKTHLEVRPKVLRWLAGKLQWVYSTECPGSLDINRLTGEIHRFYYGIAEANPQSVETPVENSAYPKIVTATATVRVRAEANTQSVKRGVKQNGESFRVIGETTGETVNGINRWYIAGDGDTGYGYVWSGATK